VKNFRYSLTRHIIHFGLWVMPRGRARDEVISLLWRWHYHVVNEVIKADMEKISGVTSYMK